MMQDPAWYAAWKAIEPFLMQGTECLAPEGNWPTHRTTCLRIYSDHIDIGDATVFVLHKARLGAISRVDLGRLCQEWHVVFANAVFVCFVRDGYRRLTLNRLRFYKHLKPLHHHIAPLAARASDTTSCFLHIPKTGGTSAWRMLSPTVRAKIYYESNTTFEQNPPDPRDYDLIGGHVFLCNLERDLTAQTRVFGILRDPVERFRSAFLHARRKEEDPGALSPTMRRMRESDLGTFLEHPDAYGEANMQTLMLGATTRLAGQSLKEGQHLERALQAVDAPHTRFTTVARAADLLEEVQSCLQLKRRTCTLGQFNRADTGRQQADIEEFERYRPRVAALAELDTLLYQRVAGAH